MTHELYFEQETFEEEYFEQTDERCTYERHWLDSCFYEDARFM